MKEMCRNFICSNNHCPQANATMTQVTTTQTDMIPDPSIIDCSRCVLERIGLAQAYVPSQPYTTPMQQEQSLTCGTAFSELVMPYCSGWNLYRFREEV